MSYRVKKFAASRCKFFLCSENFIFSSILTFHLTSRKRNYLFKLTEKEFVLESIAAKIQWNKILVLNVQFEYIYIFKWGRLKNNVTEKCAFQGILIFASLINICNVHDSNSQLSTSIFSPYMQSFFYCINISFKFASCIRITLRI